VNFLNFSKQWRGPDDVAGCPKLDDEDLLVGRVVVLAGVSGFICAMDAMQFMWPARSVTTKKSAVLFQFQRETLLCKSAN
jgi:hypothetical protein